ncbi:DUF6463 family protein [Blastococcus deserti]|uniref:DUF6463 family protein n=1 Tax=Blastococcus deserti TaxID=2259033 RepID=A0ABW4XCP9_9ACTN
MSVVPTTATGTGTAGAPRSSSEFRPHRQPGSRRSPGWWLQCLGVAHGVVGVGLYRQPLAQIARGRIVGSVPDTGDKATAFWFMVAAPTLWLGGRLLRSAESHGDSAAQRTAGGILTVTGLTGSALMPTSGFWGVAAVGISSLRRSIRRR